MAALFSASALFGAQDKPAGYAGSETCKTCHEDLFPGFAKNPHRQLETDKKRGFETRACESCHGPGAKHAESATASDISNPAKLPAAKADKGCLTCHLNKPTHSGRIQGSHAKNQVACVSCHAMHKGPEKLVVRKTAEVNRLCASCHNSAWAEFQRPHRHKLPEGAMSCVNCHNPHGGLLPRMMQTVSANEPGCLSCHGDKRGPFAFPHAPVKLGSCAQCHAPHGSMNPRMLVRAEVRFLCLECHSNVTTAKTLGGIPPGFHDLRSPRFQNCTVCHVKIHGSHVNPELLR